jgi:hypothetical protein
MDQMTQQNAAMVEQSTAASHALASEAAQLAELISHFRIGDGESARRPAASQPAPRRAPVRAQSAPAIHGNLALKQTAPASGGWDEF